MLFGRKTAKPQSGLDLEIEVFRAGDYGPKGAYDNAALDALAADYDPERHEAPVTLDHDQAGPAFGWVASLGRKGDRLVARVHMLSEELIGLIRKGAYKKRSIELYRKFPDTGRPYLRALSFLGACPPEVKGLADPVFAEGGPSDAILFGADGEKEIDEAPLNEEQAEKFAEALAEKRRAEFDLFRETLRREGRWLPAWEAMGVREFCERLAGAESVRFNDDRAEIALLEWFRNFLQRLPAAVPLEELGAESTWSEDDEWTDTLPRRMRGVKLNGASLALHRRACELRRGTPELSYGESLRRAAESV